MQCLKLYFMSTVLFKLVKTAQQTGIDDIYKTTFENTFNMRECTFHLLPDPGKARGGTKNAVVID